jgi:ankyrin repeat protein
MFYRYEYIYGFNTDPLFQTALNGDYNKIKELGINSDNCLYNEVTGDNIFWYLALSGNYSAVKQAIDDNPDLNNYLIYYGLACSGNYSALKQAICDNPEILNMKNKSGTTIWHYLARSGNYLALKQAINDYPDILYIKNNYASSVWFFLAWSGNYTEQGLGEAIDDYPEIKTMVNNIGISIFHYLALSGNYNQLKEAINDHPDIFFMSNEYKVNIFHYFALSGNYEALEEIIADVSYVPKFKTKFGYNVFYYFAKSGNYNDLKKYIEKYDILSNVAEYNLHIFHMVAESGNYIAVKQMITDYPDSINYKTKKGRDIFSFFMQSNNYYSIKLAVNDGYIKLQDLSENTINELKIRNLLPANLNGIQKYIKDHKIDIEKLENIPNEFVCSISNQLMQDPVVTEHGSVYDRKSIEKWFKEHDTDPLNNLKVSTKLMFPSIYITQGIIKYLEGFKNTPQDLEGFKNTPQDLENLKNLGPKNLIVQKQKVFPTVVYLGSDTESDSNTESDSDSGSRSRSGSDFEPVSNPDSQINE